MATVTAALPVLTPSCDRRGSRVRRAPHAGEPGPPGPGSAAAHRRARPGRRHAGPRRLAGHPPAHRPRTPDRCPRARSTPAPSSSRSRQVSTTTALGPGRRRAGHLADRSGRPADAPLQEPASPSATDLTRETGSTSSPAPRPVPREGDVVRAVATGRTPAARVGCWASPSSPSRTTSSPCSRARARPAAPTCSPGRSGPDPDAGMPPAQHEGRHTVVCGCVRPRLVGLRAWSAALGSGLASTPASLRCSGVIGAGARSAGRSRHRTSGRR